MHIFEVYDSRFSSFTVGKTSISFGGAGGSIALSFAESNFRSNPSPSSPPIDGIMTQAFLIDIDGETFEGRASPNLVRRILSGRLRVPSRAASFVSSAARRVSNTTRRVCKSCGRN